MNCYPLPPSYTYKYSHSYSGYQPSYSTKSLHSDKSSTKSNPRWSRKSSKQAMPPADDFEKGLMRTSQESRSYSTFSSSADSMKSRSTSTSSASGSSSLRKPSMSTKSTKTNKSSDSNKSSRSWIKRIFVGDVDEDESEEDREAKRRERNAMWRNMSMGYERVHVYADVGEFIGRAFRGAGTWSGGWPGSMPATVSPFYNGL